MRIAAGILMIIVGIIGGSLWVEASVALGLLSMVIPIVSGICAVSRISWKLTLAGAIFIIFIFPFTGLPVFSIIFFPVIGILITLILIIRRQEFKKGIKP